MKKKQVIKFMKNAGIATGVTFSMLALNIQGTKGLPDNSGQTVESGDTSLAAPTDNTALSGSANLDNTVNTEELSPDSVPSASPEESDGDLTEGGTGNPGEDNSQGSDGGNCQEPGDEDSQLPGDELPLPDGDGDLPGDDGDVPPESGSPQPPAGENSQEPDNGDSQPDGGGKLPDSENSQNPDNNTGQADASDAQKPEGGTDSTKVSDSQTQEDAHPAAGQTYCDTNPGAVYIQNFYTASEAFIDQREKVKYNAALPIEGIPAFVTQEMIIGALKCQDETGYPASVTIAQIIQESGFGTYGPDGSNGLGLSYLAYQYCNLFGVKGMGPAGSVNMRTGEMDSDGSSYMTTSGFRVYNTYTESIEDRTKLLNEMYSDLTAGVTDSNTFAMRIGGRWATDIRYSQSLIQQMETYDLYRLDRMTLTDFSQMIGTFANPCPGSNISSTFGYRTFDNDFHKGLDLGTGSANIPTYAAEAGTIITAGFSESAGNWVVIDHGNGLVTKYMHHDRIYVEEGQHVEKGQQIGLSGTTGYSTGNHLHFQVEENGLAVDPTPYLGL